MRLTQWESHLEYRAHLNLHNTRSQLWDNATVADWVTHSTPSHVMDWGETRLDLGRLTLTTSPRTSPKPLLLALCLGRGRNQPIQVHVDSYQDNIVKTLQVLVE